MNTKTLFKLGTMLAIMLVLFVGNAFATKYYVNVVTGLDGYDGLSALYTTGATGPKYTINNAITAASPGDTIVVDYGNGNLYNEVVNANKLITFASSNNTGTGVPVVYGFNINNAVASPGNIVKFINPFAVTTSFTLTIGIVNGANNLTVTGLVDRVIAASTVDAQMNYAGTVNFQYDATMTTGFEMVPASNTTNGGALSTTAGATLTLGHNVTINGILTTTGPLDLVAGQTLAIIGANTHVVGGNILNGTLAFTCSGGNPIVNGNFDLPTVTAVPSSSTARTLTLNTNTKIGDVTANGAATVAIPNLVAGGVGNLTNNGSGNITLTLTLASKSLTNTSSGQIQLNAAGAMVVTGNVTQSGTGAILFNSTTSNSISGSVTQNAALTFVGGTGYLGVANRSVIRFVGDFPVTIGGSVTNTTSFTGVTTSTITTYNNVGEISFGSAATAVAITGAVVVNPSHTLTSGNAAVSIISLCGDVTFASTTGAVTITGGITNSTNWPVPTGFTMLNDGDVNISLRTSGVLTVGAITSTSVTTTGGNDGNILLGGTTGNVIGSSVSTSGGTGGFITFGGTTATFAFSGGMTNSRTPSGVVYITVGGAVATAGAAVSIGGDLIQNGAARTSFPSFLGAAGENFTVTGALNISAGSVYVNNGTQLGGGAFTFGTVTMTGGTVDIGTVGGASVMNIVVQGNATFTAGTWKSGGAVGRTLRLGGLVNKFSAPSNRTDFVSGANMANVLLLLQPVSVVALQTFTGDATQTIWPGPMQIINGSGLTPAAMFTGGNFRFLGNVKFTTGQVNINGISLFIGGQLAPYLGAGTFENVAGYTTTTVGTQNGFISMNGNAAQSVTVLSTGTFWNFEVDNAAGVTMFVTAKFKGTFNLTNGAITTPNLIDFDNTTTPPTIVVNAGSFAAVPPTFTSMVSVYYIGVDKFTGNELPLAADKLFNLTVATTNGTNVIGKGVVRINNITTTVNGTLNIFAGQALNMVGTTTITMLGSAITLNGDLAGDLATNLLILKATTGTTITGPGALPNISVAVGSLGNVISGSTGMATRLLGVDQIRGTDDVNTGLVGANGGSIVFVGGAASDLTAGFGTANATTGAHLDFVTTQAGATFTLGANLIQAGILTHNAGTVSDGTFIYTLLSAGPHVLNTAASVTGTGTMQFKLGASTTLNVIGGAGTIGTNVQLLNPANVAPYVFTLGANDLTIAGNLTLTSGGVVGTTTMALGALNLTCTGSAVTMDANSSITSTGVVTFNATVAPLTFTYTGAPTIQKLTILNDVVLAGTGVGLNVTVAFVHTSGNLNFGARDLTVSGTYTRTTGTYTATTGYFIFGGTAFNQGAAPFSIPNLRFTNAGPVAAGGTGVVTVTTALDVNTAAVAPSFTHAGTLSVADKATVNYTRGSFDVPPVYVGTITLVALSGGAAVAVDASVWPAAPATLVTSFVITTTGGAATIPGNRTVNTALYLTNGTLTLVTNTLTMVNNSTVYRTDLGFVTKTTGGLTYGTGMTVVYQADGGGILTGIELPATIANLTFTRSANFVNATTTLNSNVTVTGLLSIMNDVADIGTVTLNAAGNVQILNEVGTWTNATNPVVTLTNLTFSGTGNQLFTIAANGATIFNLRIAQTGVGSTVTVTGGKLTVGGTLSFVNGILVSGTYPVVLGGLVDRTGLTGISHIFGTVVRLLAIGGGRYEYPVGSMTRYRPLSLTFPGALPPGVVLTVQHVDSDPMGILGLPVSDPATGIRIGGYPPYYWLVTTTPSLGQSIPYDMELVGTNPFGRPLNRATDLRIIHRFDGNDLLNPWYLEGSGVNYLNFLSLVAGGDTVVTVRVRGSFGGLVPEASRYDIGIPTRPPVWTLAPATLSVNEGAVLSQQFTADPQDVGETMAYSLVTPPAGMAISATGLLTWTPGYDQAGVKNVVISATDGEFIITQSVAITVVNVNRAPAFSPKTASLTKTDKDTTKVTLAATDPDGDALTYSYLSIAPAASTTPTVTGSQLTWIPAFVDAGQTYTIKAVVSDGITTGQGPTPGRDTMTVTVVLTRSRKLGDADGNGTVQAQDAAVVLQYVAGLITVTDPAQLWAMDASTLNGITAYDASLILQYAAGLKTSLPINIDGGLGKGAVMQATGTLEMASPVATTNPEVVKVGIKLSNPANVYSVSTVTTGDFSLVTIDAVNASLPEGWDMKWNVVGKELRIVAAGTTPLASGEVASILVHMKSKESRLNFSTDALLNENFQSLGAVEVAAIPTVFALEQNYPNPFNPSTTIRYQIPTDASVSLIIYNVQGQKIRTLLSKEQKAGYYSTVWDGRNEAGQTVSSGLYLYRVQAGSFVATQKMIMLK
jgi:hypothetical protein